MTENYATTVQSLVIVVQARLDAQPKSKADWETISKQLLTAAGKAHKMATTIEQ